MIVPMRKYAFLAHPSDYKSFLEGVRKVGVLHVKQKKLEPSEEVVRHKLLHREVSGVISQLKKRKREETGKAGVLDETDGLTVVQSVLDLNRKLEQIKQQLATLGKEIAYYEPWGEFSPKIIERLQLEGGIELRFFICPEKKFNPIWKDWYVLEIINTLPPDCFFIVFSHPGEKLDIQAEEIPPPKCSLSELKQKKTTLEGVIEEVNRQLDQHADQHLPLLEKTLLQIEEELDMANVLNHTALTAGDSVILLEGFVPVPKELALKDFCEKSAIVYLSGKPKPKDQPPVLLDNNRYARLFEPIGKLFSLPAYAELDLTPFFAPFFMLFFGFCLGDAGYGVVLLLGATIYKFRAKVSWRPILSLVQWLSLAAILFGMLTGTVFGINLLQDQFAWLGNIRNFMINSDQAFQLALMLGVIQILFGLVIKTLNLFRQHGLKYALTPVGWIILLLSLLDIAVLKWMNPYSNWIAWAGVGIILLFNDPDAGFFGRLGKGVWELYGITGFFGDLLSYIRLFALGTSGAILGFVINDISLRVLHGVPVLGPVLFVLLLVVGHSTNLALSVLGSFVHPLRLTFVEFYKNAGFEGGGKAYKPFEKK